MIILFDEPTVALDPEPEDMVQRALDVLRKGRTNIVVAHRMQTIVNADNNTVIEDGAAIQSGTYVELIVANGSYKDYFAK